MGAARRGAHRGPGAGALDTVLFLPGRPARLQSLVRVPAARGRLRADHHLPDRPTRGGGEHVLLPQGERGAGQRLRPGAARHLPAQASDTGDGRTDRQEDAEAPARRIFASRCLRGNRGRLPARGLVRRGHRLQPQPVHRPGHQPVHPVLPVRCRHGRLPELEHPDGHPRAVPLRLRGRRAGDDRRLVGSAALRAVFRSRVHARFSRPQRRVPPVRDPRADPGCRGHREKRAHLGGEQPVRPREGARPARGADALRSVPERKVHVAQPRSGRRDRHPGGLGPVPHLLLPLEHRRAHRVAHPERNAAAAREHGRAPGKQPRPGGREAANGARQGIPRSVRGGNHGTVAGTRRGRPVRAPRARSTSGLEPRGRTCRGITRCYLPGRAAIRPRAHLRRGGLAEARGDRSRDPVRHLRDRGHRPGAGRGIGRRRPPGRVDRARLRFPLAPAIRPLAEPHPRGMDDPGAAGRAAGPARLHLRDLRHGAPVPRHVGPRGIDRGLAPWAAPAAAAFRRRRSARPRVSRPGPST